MADLENLRPEVREAIGALAALFSFGRESPDSEYFRTIRAELLRLAHDCKEHAEWRQLNHRAYFEAKQRAERAEAELAALKARIAESCRADGQRVFDLLGLPIEFDGTLALVKVEE